MAYINCEKIAEMKNIFYDFDVKRLLRVLSSLTSETINPEETLIVLDEIQESPQEITALKYFWENLPEYHIIAAGSLVGVSLHTGTGYPVGKVDEIRMYPMTFREFLMASGNDVIVQQMQEQRWEELSTLSIKFTDLLRQYYYVGGMPEVVNNYVVSQNLNDVRQIQRRILSKCEKDFSKHVIAQELIALDLKLYYYSKEKSPLEIDFLVQKDELYPIEVTAEENLKSKSLRAVFDNNNALKPCRFSISGYRKQDWMTNVPLYLAQEWMLAQV